ncbi:MAG: hypothetical protein QXE92_01630 [Thermofilaceae archaeon]
MHHVGVEGQEERRQLNRVVRKMISLLEGLAISKGLETPTVYGVVLFHDLREINVKGLHRVSDDVFIDERGMIVARFTDVLPLLVERISTGYYALCLFKSGKAPTVDEARRLAVDDLLEILSLLASSAQGLH